MPLGLVQLVPKAIPSTTPMPRLWLIFFGGSEDTWWWTRFFRPGFRHVCAAAWFAGADRWVYFNPTRTGMVIEVVPDAEFGPRFQQLIDSSTAILRVRSSHARRNMPAAFFCVGAVKALLGVRGCALTPFGLFRHLRAIGAEPVPRPREDRFEQAKPTAGRERGPGDCRGAGAPEAARGRGQNPRDAGPAQAGNAAA